MSWIFLFLFGVPFLFLVWVAFMTRLTPTERMAINEEMA